MAAFIIPDAQSTSRPSEELKRPPLDHADSQGQWRELSPVQARARCGGVTRVAGYALHYRMIGDSAGEAVVVLEGIKLGSVFLLEC